MKVNKVNEMNDDRIFVTPYGRDMFKMSIMEWHRRVADVPDENGEWDKEFENNYGFVVGDTVRFDYFGNGPCYVEFEIIKMTNNGIWRPHHPNYSPMVLKAVEDEETLDLFANGDWYLKKGDIYEERGIDWLSWATLETPADATMVNSYKNNPYENIETTEKSSNVSKYVLEVEDFSKSDEDWKKDMYEEYGVNISVVVWENGAMCDQDVLSEIPEIEGLNLGEIQIDENGFLGLKSDLSVSEIKNKLKNAGFKIK